MEGIKHVGDNQTCLSDVTRRNVSQISTSNGFLSGFSTVPAEGSDDESERAGVFDYMPQKSMLSKNESVVDHFPNGIDSDEMQEKTRRQWAADAACISNNEFLGDRELTTFRCSSGSTHPCGSGEYCNKPRSINGYETPDVLSMADGNLQEIVVHEDIVPQKASFERYNADLGTQRYRPANNTTPVYITNIQRSSEQKNCFADYSDEGSVVERRSRMNQYQDFKDHNLPSSASADHGSTAYAVSGNEDSSLTPTTHQMNAANSVLYVGDIPRFLSRASEVSVADVPSRYYSNGGNRSDLLRRLHRKLEKRRYDQPVSGSVVSSTMSRSGDDRSVDELLAFINNMKLDEARKSQSTAASAKDKSGVRRKKKHAQTTSDISDASAYGSLDTMSAKTSDDRSVSSGSEAPDRLQTTVGDEVSPRGRELSRSNDSVGNGPDELDHDQFVVVQKKKRTKQAVLVAVRQKKWRRR